MESDGTYTLRLTSADDAPFAFAASPAFARDGLCYAACGSGLYRSADGGAAWDLLPTSPEPVTTAVALSPAFSDDRSLFAAVKGGVLRSADGGDTWFTAGFPAPPPVFSSLAVSPDFERDGFLLAGTLEDGVFSSSDRGRSWQPWNFGLFDLNVLCLALSPAWMEDETAFAGTETGLYRSTNGGRAWRHTGFPAELAPALCIACLVDERSRSARLLVGTESNGLMASCDQGETWERLAADNLSEAVNQLHVDANGGVTLYAMTSDAVMRSDDGGLSWSDLIRVEGVATAMLPLGDILLLGVQGKGLMRLPLE
ncbi:MAG: hypothetical protein OXG53_00805 [Chloroflexi bacterium]|nr:hypothetical protein [Chloroflexota bacterium]